jgi:hypothetical protein
MGIQIVPHDDRYRDAVDAFNRRMREGGSPFGFYVDPVPRWIPRTDSAPVWREYYLAVEDDSEVRAGYALKPQEWWVHGRSVTVCDSQGPFSESAINPRFGSLGLRIFRDMAKRQKHLYSWGHGGAEEVIVQLIEKLGWHLHPTHLALRVLHPSEFLRKNAFLRERRERALALDFLAATGLGEIGLRGLHLALAARRPTSWVKLARAEVVPEFGSWADEVWATARDDYQATALRDARGMNALLPAGERQPEWSEPVRLRVESLDGRDVGWAVVLVRRLENHPRFGDLCVGTLADAFGPVSEAPRIIRAATHVMRELGADLVVANQAHEGWVRGYEAAGWLTLPKKRLFAVSPGLQELLAPLESTLPGVLLGNLDGHGPMGM